MAVDDSSRSYWRWSKNDFFPGPSFQDFSSYKSAFCQTGPRLRERLCNRSTEEAELVELRKESKNELKKCLTWWDLIWLGFGSVVGSGVFVFTGQEAHDHAGPAIMLSYAASGASALFSVFCYTEFAVEIPSAGGSFSFLRIELGDFFAFIAAGNILLEAIVGAAGLARSWSSYFATLINKDTDFFRIHISCLPDGFNYLDPVAVLVLVIVNSVSMSGTKRTSILNSVASVVNASVIVFIMIAGFTHVKPSNWKPFVPNGAEGIFQAAAVVYWSYTGFDLVATMAEETKKPSRDIPIGLVGSMTVVTILYCLMSLVLTGMQKYTDIDRAAGFSIAFERVGMSWAKYLVSLCALIGMTTSTTINSLGYSRYLTQIARSHMIPPWFSLIHPSTATPINANLLIALLSIILAFFSSLDVLASVLSISTLFIFMLVAFALLVRRYYVKDITPRNGLIKFLICSAVIFGSSIVMTVLWSFHSGRIGYAIAGLGWLLGTTGMALLPKQRAPKIWGVPLVPLLPSLSIVLNVFLMGSLGRAAFMRFIICSAVMLIYYFFVGVHATFDVAHHNREHIVAEEGRGNSDQEKS